MPDITSVTVTFGHGIKREEYGPVKRAEVSLTASVAEGELGEHVLAMISTMAIAKVAEMLDAPKPDLTANSSQEGGKQPGEAPARRSRKKADQPQEATASEVASSAEDQPSARTEESEGDAKPTEPAPAVEDEWSVGAEAIEITDAQLLAATSKRAGELGSRDPILKLITTFATRTDGPPFKVQEIPQAQRQDYLNKLAALTA